MKKTKEKSKKNYTVGWMGLLIFVYLAMLSICLYFNQGNTNRWNWVINGAMFSIVLLIFVLSIVFCFQKINKIKGDIKKAIEQIRDDHKGDAYLWDTYKENDPIVFGQSDLAEAYESYKMEMQYLESQNSDNSICDIENYINRELIDDIAKKNLLNLVPGAMTGMGILGTFIGLSLGLQNFNTGTSEEIAKSIAPLMDGIKVAFHTSIYGMVFSLFFNLIYKKIFEDAYLLVDEFVDIYHKNVVPDADNDNINKLIAGQQRQTQSIVNPIVTSFQRLNDNIETMCVVQQKQLEQIQQMPYAVAEQIAPKIDTLNNNFEVFAKMVGDTQMKGMEGLIDKFTSQTNAVMTDSFQNLKSVISQTCDLQAENSEHMQMILAKVQGMTLSIQQINELSQKTVMDMSGYVERVENLQGILNDNCRSFGEQMEQNAVFEERMKDYVISVEAYQKQCEQAAEQSAVELKRQVEIFEEMEKKIMEDVRNEMELLFNNSSECNRQISEASAQQIASISNVFDTLDEKIKDMTENLTGCMRSMVQEFDDTSQGINEQLRNEIMKTLAEFSEGFAKNITDMTVKLGASAEQMSSEATKLGTMAQDFNGQLKKNLTDSLNIFDKELADICTHLSGTISDIQSTTERVPRVVGEAFKGMEKSVSEVEIQMMELINQVTAVNETVRKQAQAMRNNETEQNDNSLSL